MKIQNVPFEVIDWDSIPNQEYKGETGTSYWQTINSGNIRVRKVEYSPNFKSDHFCSRGHILLVLEGELFIKLKNGETYSLQAGKSFHCEDDDFNPHLAYSDTGAIVFIVD